MLNKISEKMKNDNFRKKFSQILNFFLNFLPQMQGWRTWGVRGVLGLPNISRLEEKLQFKMILSPQFWDFLNQIFKKNRALRAKTIYWPYFVSYQRPPRPLTSGWTPQ